MVVLSEICEICKYTCNAIYFQQTFDNWTSGNNDIDKFIQNTQLLAHGYMPESLEWISYDRFYDIKYITNGGFGKVYRLMVQQTIGMMKMKTGEEKIKMNLWL